MKPSQILLASFAAAAPVAAVADGALPAFDVAEDLSRFVYDEAPRFEDDMPAYGNAFVTQGYVYPAGTLDGGVEGTLANGSPAFPDKVIGTWTCDGYYVSDGLRTKSGTIVVTRQVIVFNDGDVLITQGPEAGRDGGRGRPGRDRRHGRLCHGARRDSPDAARHERRLRRAAPDGVSRESGIAPA